VELIATWVGTVSDLSVQQLGDATKRCIQHLKCEYPPHFPTVAQFRELSQRVEPKGAFTAQQTPLPEYRGLPEPEGLKSERLARSKIMMGRLMAAVRDSDPPTYPEPDGKITRGITTTGIGFQMWTDIKGRDYIHYPGHQINEKIKKGGSGFEPDAPTEGRKYGRAFEPH